jgi:serine/threonine protein kinase
MSVAQACHIGLKAAEGLAYVHRQGVTHCDLSPRNIRLTFGGQTKLIDFGVAKSRDLEESGPRRREDGGRGTYAYMSPEQVEYTAPIGPRSDVYALGVCLWEMLTGERFVEAETSVEMLEAVAHPDTVAPSEHNEAVPKALDGVVLRALAADPTERYSSANPLVEDLASVIEASSLGYSAHHISDCLGSIFSDELEAEERKRQRWASLRCRSDLKDYAVDDPDEEACHRSVTVGESRVADGSDEP